MRRFPIDTIKIDRAFLRSVPDGVVGCDVIAAIVALASHMRLRTVAEGIEEPRQLEFLRSCGCALGQGFLLGRPAPAEAIVAALRPA